jgi:N-acetyl-alpha-D-glucosaminyl L-malate synthase BshA
MKIGIVCYPTFGGSGVVATELGMGLARKGHQVHFITSERPVRLSSFQENVYFHEVSSRSYPLFQHTPYETALASKLVDVVTHEKLDILHVHYAIPHAAVAYMAKQILKTKGYNIPIVTTLHGTDITLVGTDKSFAPVVEFSINNSDGVTAVSNHLRNQTMDAFNITNEIKVIYNFIDFNRFKKTDKEHFKKAIAPEGEKVIVHTSNFRMVKRVQDVIRVFAEIHKKIDSKLLMIGDGPERQSLEILCREMSLCDHIRFLGKQHAVEELLSLADLFIIPSENESFGLAALEAMACEVPVISSDVGGLTEVNIHGETGYTCGLGNIKEMSEGALKILLDESLHNTMKANALKRAKEFAIDNILPVYEDYYKQLIERLKPKQVV